MWGFSFEQVTLVDKSAKPQLRLYSNATGEIASGVGPGVGLTLIEALFPSAASTIRIASAYFSLAGYRLARDHIRDSVQIHVLVGREDGSDLREAVIQEIRSDLAKIDVELWDAVSDLVRRMADGRFFIRDARRVDTPFHCKFYACDATALWHGSANYTKNGLTKSGNAEQASVTRDQAEIGEFVRWYDDVASRSADLLAELRALLEDWLKLAKPFDVYLAALRELYELAAVEALVGGHQALYYQKAIVGRAVNQIRDYRGALAVVATGLGKTVIGADVAHRLRLSRDVERVVLIAPRAVHAAWREQLNARRITPDFFTPEILFRRSGGARHHQAAVLEENLRLADSRTLVIIDEAHFARNQLLAQIATNSQSLVLKRLLPAKQNSAKFLLLTATPYSTNATNLSSLLALLPATQPGLSGLTVDWGAEDVRAFTALDVVSVLGYPHLLDIARKRGDIDENDRPFVRVRNQPSYLPRTLHLRILEFRPVADDALQVAFSDRCFTSSKLVQHVYVDESGDVRKGRTDPVTNATISAWFSSPAALLDALERNLATPSAAQLEAIEVLTAPSSTDSQLSLPFGSAAAFERNDAAVSLTGAIAAYGTPMARDLSLRRAALQPIIDTLRSVSVVDFKLQRLSKLVLEHGVNRKEKILIFVRKLPTATYVESRLRDTFKTLSVSSTVMVANGRSRLRPLFQRDALRRLFCPVAHDETKPSRQVDVLVCTDADSVGVNLQDANVVVNYDLPDASDVLFQRAGRVLRMTPRADREVFFYSFVPKLGTTVPEAAEASKRASRIAERVVRRHTDSRRILGTSVLPQSYSESVGLETEVDVEDFLRREDSLEGWFDSPAASAANRLSILEQHAERAKQLGPSLHSALAYSGQLRAIFVLIRHQGRPFAMIYDLDAEQFLRLTESQALDLIACDDSQLPAPALARDVEAFANQVVRTWCELNGTPYDHVVKVCAMLLLPRDGATNIDALLSPRSKSPL